MIILLKVNSLLTQKMFSLFKRVREYRRVKYLTFVIDDQLELEAVQDALDFFFVEVEVLLVHIERFCQCSIVIV